MNDGWNVYQSQFMIRLEKKLDLILDQLQRKAKPKAMTQDDEAWLAGLCNDPVNVTIDVRAELGKAQKWCLANKRKCTRRFFESWLTRADRTVTVQVKGQEQKPDLPPIMTRPVEKRAPGVPPPQDVIEKLGLKNWGSM